MNDRFLRRVSSQSTLSRLSMRALPNDQVKGTYEIAVALDYLSLEELVSLWDIYGVETPHVRKPRTNASVFQIDQLFSQLHLPPFHALFKAEAVLGIKWFALQDQRPGLYTLVRSFDTNLNKAMVLPLEQDEHYTNYYMRQRVELKWICEDVNPAWVLYWNAMKPDTQIDVTRMEYNFLMAGLFWQRVIPSIMCGEEITGVFEFTIRHFHTIAITARRFDLQLYSSTAGEIERLFLRVARCYADIQLIVSLSRLKLETDAVKWAFWFRCARICDLKEMECLLETIFQKPLLEFITLVQSWLSALTYAVSHNNEKLVIECVASDSYRSALAVRALVGKPDLLHKCMAKRQEHPWDFDDDNLVAASRMDGATAAFLMFVDNQGKPLATLLGALANSKFFVYTELANLIAQLNEVQLATLQQFFRETDPSLQPRYDAIRIISKT